MPRYYFGTDDGKRQFRDEDGVELADEQEARDLGAKAMGEMAKDYLPGGEPQKNITMWVRSEDGQPLLQLALTFAVQPLKTRSGDG